MAPCWSTIGVSISLEVFVVFLLREEERSEVTGIIYFNIRVLMSLMLSKLNAWATIRHVIYRHLKPATNNCVIL
jgi:hypothetical protein